MRASTRFRLLGALAAFLLLALASARGEWGEPIKIEGGQISGAALADDPAFHVRPIFVPLRVLRDFVVASSRP